MQAILRETLVEKAKALLADGTVDRVIGWKAGEFAYDLTPAVFHSAEEVESGLVWNDFCGANFSKYLLKETKKSENKVKKLQKKIDDMENSSSLKIGRAITFAPRKLKKMLH